MDITKEQLEDLYYRQELSFKTIKKILHISSKTLAKYKKEFSLQVRSKEKILEITKKTNLKKYGCENPMQNKGIQNKAKETIKREKVVEKRKQTCLEKYGVEIPSQNEAVLQKMYKTNIEKYGNYCSCNNTEVKNKISKKVKKAYSSGIPKKKEYETKKLNNTWNSSKPEEEAYKLLLTRFNKEDIIRQYSSPLYNYSCDFYIKSLDLYIECQFTWTHGKEPFNENNKIHKKLVEKWNEKNTEYYLYAIKVWTYYDPLKRKTAKENNLNWKEFFNLEELEEYLLNLS